MTTTAIDPMWEDVVLTAQLEINKAKEEGDSEMQSLIDAIKIGSHVGDIFCDGACR